MVFVQPAGIPANQGSSEGTPVTLAQKEKSEYSTFKYSIRLTGSLHEAIMLRSEPFFLTYFPATQSFDLVRKIEEVNRILVPPYPEEYPYDPIEFQSKKELQEYIDLASNETIDSLYQKIKGQVSLYIDQDEEIIILMYGDILWTYFQDLYSTTHYYDVNGKINGIGKSSIGHVFEAIAYRAIRMTDPSAANVFRSLGQIEAGQCTIIMDEADRVHKDTAPLPVLGDSDEAVVAGAKLSIFLYVLVIVHLYRMNEFDKSCIIQASLYCSLPYSITSLLY